MVRITPSILSGEETHTQMQIIVAAASFGKNKMVCKCAMKATERRRPERQANNHGEVGVWVEVRWGAVGLAGVLHTHSSEWPLELKGWQQMVTGKTL